jgi:hypothetical protein
VLTKPLTATARELIAQLSQLDDLDKPVRNKDGSPFIGLHETFDNVPNNCIIIYFASDKGIINDC